MSFGYSRMQPFFQPFAKPAPFQTHFCWVRGFEPWTLVLWLMLTCAQKGVLLFAAGILLFVVLCPATPTPTAVVKNQSALVLLLAPIVLLLWKPNLPESLRADAFLSEPFDSSHSILELTCTRLC
jgi:hypothetical protein